jgi:hypothetical protein
MIKFSSFLLVVFFLFTITVIAQEHSVEKALVTSFNFSRDHSKEPQEFIMQSQLWKIGPDGKRIDTTTYTVHLRSTPVSDGDEFTCVRFAIQFGKKNETSIPSLAGWKYIYRNTENYRDEKGQVLGIDHTPFENLKDSLAKPLSPENAYMTYNVFVDFHTMFVFAEKTPAGKGIQDLHHVGEKIVHNSAYSTPPVNLGKDIKEGSEFRNGEITLEFKGLGIINKKSCALLGYDSGASSFTMLMQYTPTMELTTVGSSHYWGDIYKDLQSGWIQQATLHEWVVSETLMGTNKVHSVIERSILIMNTRSN